MDIAPIGKISSDVERGGASRSSRKRCREMRAWLITIGLVFVAVGLLWP